MRFLHYLQIAAFGLLLTSLPVSYAAELLMVESDDCPFCQRFHAEIGKVYPKTAEGKIAPLRTWFLGTPFPENYSLSDTVDFTPTFILLDDNNNEIDRLVGYQGDEFFWFLLSKIIKKLE